MTKIFQISALLTETILIAGMMSMGTSLEPVFANNGAAKQNMDLWINDLGQTIDETKSFSVARCDDAGTLEVNGHLHKTNQAGVPLLVYLKVDNGAWQVVDTVTPNKVGNVNYDGTLSVTSGFPHTVVVAVNVAALGATIFVNSADSADPGTTTGIQFMCP